MTPSSVGKARGRARQRRVRPLEHVVLHCLRLEDGHSYRETPNRLKYMAEIRDALGLDPDDLPDYSTIYKSFDRLKMWVWRALLRVSAQQHPSQSEHAALDSTFFDRRRASSYFRQRAGRTIQTLKVTTLTDVESLAVLDVHIAARWKHDTKTGPQVVRRNADDLQSVAADNGFQDWHTEYEIAAHDIDYLFIIAARQRTQPRKTLSTGQKVTLSGGWPKHRIRQRSARSATPCERWAGIDSSVKSS